MLKTEKKTAKLQNKWKTSNTRAGALAGLGLSPDPEGEKSVSYAIGFIQI